MIPTLVRMNRRGERSSPSATALTALCIAGFSVSASILVLLVPTFFESGAQVHPLVIVGLVALSAGFAVGARYWHPPAPESDES